MQPSIFLFGIQIDEPVTCLTDLLVTAVCLLAWFDLGKMDPKSAFLRWMLAYFLVFGISTFFGGICGHAFCRLGDFNWMKMSGWLPGMLSATLLSRAAVELARPRLSVRFVKMAIRLAWFILAATTAAMLRKPDFTWVKINGFLQVIGLALPISLFIFGKTRHPGSRLFLWAIGTATVASAVFSLKFSPHVWFNHADLSHVLLALAAWFYWKGARAFCVETTA